MLELAGFNEYNPRDWKTHLERVTKPSVVYGKDRPRCIKIPMILETGGKLLMTDMDLAPASLGGGETNNRCFTVPFVWIDPKCVFNYMLFMKELEGRVHGKRGIVTQMPHRTGALGLYKDYSSDIGGLNTAITVLPFVFRYFGSNPPDIQHDYARVRGESTWVDPNEAVQRLTVQILEMPDNKLASDALAIVEYSRIKVFGNGVLNATHS